MNFEKELVSINENAFDGCTKLKLISVNTSGSNKMIIETSNLKSYTYITSKKNSWSLEKEKHELWAQYQAEKDSWDF